MELKRKKNRGCSDFAMFRSVHLSSQKKESKKTTQQENKIPISARINERNETLQENAQ